MKGFTSALAAAVGLVCIIAGHARADSFVDKLGAADLASTPTGSDRLYLRQGTVSKYLPGDYFLRNGGPLGTPSSASLANATGLPISSGVSGLAPGIVAFLSGSSSAALRAAITDEVGTGPLYFQGGDLGAPSAGNATNLTGLPIVNGTTGTLTAARGGTGQATYSAGQLLIGKIDGTLAKATLTAGANVTITNGDGTIAISASGGGGGALTNGVLGDILRSDGIGGFGTPLTLGPGVAAFLGAPAGTIPGSWLAPSAIADRLGFTPASNAITFTGTGMIAGGGDHTTNRTFDLAPAAAKSVLMNPTGSSAVPVAVAVPDNCGDNGITFTSGAFGCGVNGGGGGGSLTTTDGATSVPNTTTLTFSSKNFVVGTPTGGSATVDLTYTVGTDQSGGDYTFVTGDSATMTPIGASHTYTLPQAGSAGFAAGWSGCMQNVSASGNATVSTSTSVFKGAGGGSSFLLEAGGWACVASSGGDWFAQIGHFDTFPSAVYLTGSLAPSALAGNVNDYNPAGLANASALFIDGGAADRNITGLQGGADGRIVTVTNNGATNSLTLVNASGSSSAGNRFQLSGDTVLPPNTSATLRYDAATSRWRPLSRTLSNTTVTPGSYTCTDVTVGSDGRLTSASSGSCTGGGGVTTAFETLGWIPTVDPGENVILTATTGATVTAIRGTVVAAAGAAATVAVYKAPSGTACASGTIQHSGTFDANGTANTNQTLTLAGGGANSLAAGDRLCLVTTGGANWTGGGAKGAITVAYTTP